MEDKWRFVCAVMATMHVYKNAWDPYMGDSFSTKHKQNNQHDNNVMLTITHAFARTRHECRFYYLGPVSDSLQSISISDINAFEGLSSFDPAKAKGIDNIGPQILKSCAFGLCAPLHHLFELSLSNGIIPAQ